MRYEIDELKRRIGNEFYFTLIREDGTKGEIQLNMRLIVETDFDDHIEWEDD